MRDRRFRRLGKTGKATVAVSAGALVLVMGGAPPAHAATAAAGKPCPKIVDPQSAVKHIQCQLDKIRKKLTPKPDPKPAQPPKKKAKITKPAKKKPSTPTKTTKNRPKTTVQVPSGSAEVPRVYSAPGLKPYEQTVQPGLSGYLPAPEVAAQPVVSGQSGAFTGTRLIAPVAATERQGGRDEMVLWTALAAGAAGAVGAMQISIVGRSLRRRQELR